MRAKEGTMDQLGSELRKFILDGLKQHAVKVAKEGEPLFELASGIKSYVYIDVSAVSMAYKYSAALGSLLYRTLCSSDFGFCAVGCVAGVVLGGCHLASSTAVYGSCTSAGSVLDVIYVRKDPKMRSTRPWVIDSFHNDDFKTDINRRRVVVIEDVVTTGQSVLNAIEHLAYEGYVVVGVLAVVDRRAKVNRDAYIDGLPFKALFTIDELLEKSHE
jgi:orotate phosphoribosyltransferase